jgi:UDP-N-acetyl-D-galactosamine dehydrogenase
LEQIKRFYKNGPDKGKVLIDVKGLYKIEDLKQSGLKYWRL